MIREVRCQGVILREKYILVLRQYNSQRQEEYWMLPGGCLEEGETFEECIIREIREETNLEVEIEEILFDEAGEGKDKYQRYITYLCKPKQGSIEKAGKETVSYRKILGLIWCAINEESKWNEHLLREQFYPSMRRIKERLESLKRL